ncbi:hypothetical protein [Rhodococcus jostii]|uniref:hypothetical protein n=1 Tax=Rhodococcus jostii TaxID=132919 RepID=UPI00364A8637
MDGIEPLRGLGGETSPSRKAYLRSVFQVMYGIDISSESTMCVEPAHPGLLESATGLIAEVHSGESCSGEEHCCALVVGIGHKTRVIGDQSRTRSIVETFRGHCRKVGEDDCDRGGRMQCAHRVEGLEQLGIEPGPGFADELDARR